jgi:RecA-family ATPase
MNEEPKLRFMNDEEGIGRLQADIAKIHFLDMSNWDDEPAPPREWVVADRIPLEQPTLFSGPGAAGKSLCILQLATAAVLGRPWLGLPVTPGPVIYVSAEDAEKEIHRRMVDIAGYYQVSFKDIMKGGLHIAPLAGEDALLGNPDRNGIIRPTDLFQETRKIALDIQPRMIVFDTASDVFGGNENDRFQVRQFLGMQRGLAIETHSAVIIISHPSLSGISSGQGTSGSTMWHNGVRSRVYLREPTGEEADDPDLRELHWMKNNYGPKAGRMLIRWQNGVYVPDFETSTPLSRDDMQKQAEDTFVEILTRFNRQNRNASPNKGPGYAPSLFAKEPEAKRLRVEKAALDRAMCHLLESERIRVEQYGKPCNPHSRLVVGRDEGVNVDTAEHNLDLSEFS